MIKNYAIEFCIRKNFDILYLSLVPLNKTCADIVAYEHNYIITDYCDDLSELMSVLDHILSSIHFEPTYTYLIPIMYRLIDDARNSIIKQGKTFYKELGGALSGTYLKIEIN